MAGLAEIMQEWNDEKRAQIESADQQRKIDEALPVALTARFLILNRADLIEAGWEIEASDGDTVVATHDNHMSKVEGSYVLLRMTDMGEVLQMRFANVGYETEINRALEFFAATNTSYIVH